MKYSILNIKARGWSTKQFAEHVENIVNEKAQEGFEIINVSFGNDFGDFPSAFVTVRK